MRWTALGPASCDLHPQALFRPDWDCWGQGVSFLQPLESGEAGGEGRLGLWSPLGSRSLARVSLVRVTGQGLC